MTLSCIQQPHEHLNANLEHGVLTLAINRPEAKMHYTASFIYGLRKPWMKLIRHLKCV